MQFTEGIKNEPRELGEFCSLDTSFAMAVAKSKSVKSKNITLDLLIRDGVLEPGKEVFSVKYLGQTLTADLMEDGKIKSKDGTVYISPSSWAIACKKQINPGKTSGCGWGSIRYKGKSLDFYKTKWMGNKGLQNDADIDSNRSSPFFTKINKPRLSGPKDLASQYSLQTLQRLSAREMKPSLEREHDSTECELPKLSTMPITEYERCFGTQVQCEGVDITLQVKMNPHILLTMLRQTLSSREEVSGYLAGKFDPHFHTGTVTDLLDRDDPEAQSKVYNSGLKLIGWYHSHPDKSYHPSLYDVENHLHYQLQMVDQPLIAFIIGGRELRHDDRKLSLLAYSVSSPKLKYSEKFGSLSEKCGKPRTVEWSINTEHIDLNENEHECIKRFIEEHKYRLNNSETNDNLTLNT